MDHKEQKLSTIRRLKLEAIKKIVQNIPVNPETRYLEHWEAMADRAESELANKIRNVLSTLPKGYTDKEQSLKNQAKERFLQWKRNQAQAEWKKLPAVERERWEAYVVEGIEFGEIREREIKRAEDFQVGDVVRLHHHIGYQGSYYPAGSEGTIVGVGYDEVNEEETFLVVLQNQHLKPMYAHTHELRKVL